MLEIETKPNSDAPSEQRHIDAPSSAEDSTHDEIRQRSEVSTKKGTDGIIKVNIAYLFTPSPFCSQDFSKRTVIFRSLHGAATTTNSFGLLKSNGCRIARKSKVSCYHTFLLFTDDN